MREACLGGLIQESAMKKNRVARCQLYDNITQQIIRLCFDPGSIDRYSPGLKLLYATDDPPLFVMLEEVEADSGLCIYR
jgi:hypothetical protein